MKVSLMRQRHDNGSIRRIPVEEVNDVLDEFAREKNMDVDQLVTRLQSGNDVRNLFCTLWLVIDPE